MDSYPKNQIYVIVPVTQVGSLVGDFLEVARKSLDEKFIIWNFARKDKKKQESLKHNDIKLLRHDEALKLMGTDKWFKPIEITEFKDEEITT